MSIKETIKKIFLDNTDYMNPNQAVNQASSLNALSGDLYTDSKRFIYELLQNADDSPIDNSSVIVWIKIFDDNLIIAHSGKSFTSRDLHGICNINNGTKKTDLTKTGYKGIGFKSVFGQSDKVSIYTAGEYFRFDASYPFDWKWEGSKEIWEEENDRKFQFPWQIIPIYTECSEINSQIDEYLKEIKATVATIIKLKNTKETTESIFELCKNLNMFLFLKNISQICIDLEEQTTIQLNPVGDDRVILMKNNETVSEWMKHTITLEVPSDINKKIQDERNIPDKLLQADKIELTLAAKIEKGNIVKLSNYEKLLYSYLPTGETKYTLPVLANTSFLTTANRESLHEDSQWNQWIFKEIAIEIFRWISQLVHKEFGFQAYQLIPDDTVNNKLGCKFNEGIKEALHNIPFIISREGNLLKIEETIVDFTYLSEKDFIGENPIKEFISLKDKRNRQFAKSSGYFFKFKGRGASAFEWKDLSSFFSSECFKNSHTIPKNIELIKYLKNICEIEKVKEVSREMLKGLTFIWDHKNKLNYPTRVCFPSADDKNWDNPDSDLSFLHSGLQQWLIDDPDSRLWLECLGVEEKTDITYITQNILPRIDSYITMDNAIETISDLFRLYKKGELNKDLLSKLSSLKLLTQKNTLRAAKECYLADFYRPRVAFETILNEDIFVNETYCKIVNEKDEWKQFFKKIGVQDGVNFIKYDCKYSTQELMNRGINKEYFSTPDKSFKPFVSTFWADSFRNIITLNNILFTENNPLFAEKFWSDIILNYSPDCIEEYATAYWGRPGMEGRTRGDSILNFIPWYIRNTNCIPILSGQCKNADNVLLNTEKNIEISGNYLSVFNGPQLTNNWKAFFNFKADLELDDYLELLRIISLDTDENGFAKSDNYERIQNIYAYLLSQCTNWSDEIISQIDALAENVCLLDTNNQFIKCNELKYFIDGNEGIFQEQYKFIKLSAENKQHPNIESLLGYFKVKILRQSEFRLEHSQLKECYELKDKLKSIYPYLKIWIETEDNDIKESIINIESKIDILKVYEADNLSIVYDSMDFSKGVNSHYDNNVLYVTDPWNSNSVLLKLPEILCRYFEVIGHDKKLDFLLRSTINEIRQYFLQEKMELPNIDDEKLVIQANLSNKTDAIEENMNNNLQSYEELEDALNTKHIPEKFYHLSKPEFEKLLYIQQLIPRAIENVIKHLSKLQEYDCSNYYIVAESIIGGITKNGNDITVIARPSDNKEVLLYYTSEYDVLDYVDAEFWCEDGKNVPMRISFGKILKETGINRIPIDNVEIEEYELDEMLNKPKSDEMDFDAIPFAPQKIAKIIASFANTKGGTLIFGVKQITIDQNEVVGLSTDFNINELMRKAISLLHPIPNIVHNWINIERKPIYFIKVEKSEDDVLLAKQKYIRQGTNSIIENTTQVQQTILNTSNIERNIAIIIAIEEYTSRKEDQIPPVKYAMDDALLFKQMLIDSMQIEEDNICMFTNENALKSNLEYELRSLFYELTEQDRLIFYFVGHGFHNGTTNYLSTYDMHPYNIADTAISLRKILLDPLKKSKCKNALIFIDACAQSFQDENSRNQISNINDEELKLINKEFPYYAAFLSCQPGQSSFSSDKLKHGIWTHYLVEAISGKEPSIIQGGRYITDRLLQDYLAEKVSVYTKEELNRNQNPRAILDSSYENIIINI